MASLTLSTTWSTVSGETEGVAALAGGNLGCKRHTKFSSTLFRSCPYPAPLLDGVPGVPKGGRIEGRFFPLLAR